MDDPITNLQAMNQEERGALLVKLSEHTATNWDAQDWKVRVGYDDQGAVVHVHFIDAVSKGQLPLRLLQPVLLAREVLFPLNRPAANS